MPDTIATPVHTLALDLANFRMRPQPDEASAVKAMASVSPKHFYALMVSLLDDGYLPTENILVLRLDVPDNRLVVKEGNRRVGILKYLLGLLPACDLALPSPLADRLRRLPAAWPSQNASVPCTIYPQSEAATVDRIVSLAHGKGVDAGRDDWTAVARARHNRDALHKNEPALTLLETYLEIGENLTRSQALAWSGDYPITVLLEALKKIAPRLSSRNSAVLAARYPAVPYRQELDNILRDIGLGVVGFPLIRDPAQDWLVQYGLPPTAAAPRQEPSTPEPSGAPAGSAAASPVMPPSGEPAGAPADPAVDPAAAPAPARRGSRAAPIKDPQTVKAALKQLRLRGANRQKVATLRNEALELDLTKTPLAFCFLLRSMFELSAKAYCDDFATSGGPAYTDKDGRDRRLVDILREIVAHMSKGGKDTAALRQLHGAQVELAKPESVLSVTSLNNLVHNPHFSVTAGDIATGFANVFPLLRALNE